MLYHKTDRNVLLINPSIYEFLQLFQQLISKPQVAAYYVAQFGVSKEEVVPMLQAFFTDMLTEGIIVSEEEYALQEAELKIDETTIDSTLSELNEDFILEKRLLLEYPLMMYVAQNKTTNERVVLKILYKNDKFSKEFLEEKITKMKQEKALLQKFQGQNNILQLKDYPKTYKNLYLNTYEYIDGTKLFDYLRKQQNFSLHQRLDLIQKLLKAFATLHEQKVIHGDIHDGNVLITQNGEVKIIDFDMSFSTQDTENQRVSLGGTNGFIAPEKINPSYIDMVSSAPDFSSEVYQIGVLIHYCLYEKMPFEAPTWKQLVKKVRSTPLKLVAQTRSGEVISPNILNFLDMALSRYPQHRFASAIAMKDTFEIS